MVHEDLLEPTEELCGIVRGKIGKVVPGEFRVDPLTSARVPSVNLDYDPRVERSYLEQVREIPEHSPPMHPEA
jgi:hypothetical protein